LGVARELVIAQLIVRAVTTLLHGVAMLQSKSTRRGLSHDRERLINTDFLFITDVCTVSTTAQQRVSSRQQHQNSTVSRRPHPRNLDSSSMPWQAKAINEKL